MVELSPRKSLIPLELLVIFERSCSASSSNFSGENEGGAVFAPASPMLDDGNNVSVSPEIELGMALGNGADVNGVVDSASSAIEPNGAEVALTTMALFELSDSVVVVVVAFKPSVSAASASLVLFRTTDEVELLFVEFDDSELPVSKILVSRGSVPVVFDPSTLFVRTTGLDDGASPAKGANVVVAIGANDMASVPFDTVEFNRAVSLGVPTGATAGAALASGALGPNPTAGIDELLEASVSPISEIESVSLEVSLDKVVFDAEVSLGAATGATTGAELASEAPGPNPTAGVDELLDESALVPAAEIESVSFEIPVDKVAFNPSVSLLDASVLVPVVEIKSVSLTVPFDTDVFSATVPLGAATGATTGAVLASGAPGPSPTAGIDELLDELVLVPTEDIKLVSLAVPLDTVAFNAAVSLGAATGAATGAVLASRAPGPTPTAGIDELLDESVVVPVVEIKSVSLAVPFDIVAFTAVVSLGVATGATTGAVLASGVPGPSPTAGIDELLDDSAPVSVVEMESVSLTVPFDNVSFKAAVSLGAETGATTGAALASGAPGPSPTAGIDELLDESLELLFVSVESSVSFTIISFVMAVEFPDSVLLETTPVKLFSEEKVIVVLSTLSVIFEAASTVRSDVVELTLTESSSSIKSSSSVELLVVATFASSLPVLTNEIPDTVLSAMSPSSSSSTTFSSSSSSSSSSIVGGSSASKTKIDVGFDVIITASPSIVLPADAGVAEG